MDRPSDPATPARASTSPGPLWRRPAAWFAESWDRLLFDLMVAIPAVWLVGYLWPPINHDVGAVLNVAQRWLEGDRLYVDIIDVNMPMVFMLYAIPELLHRATGAPSTLWLTLCVYAAIVASFAVCRRLLHMTPSLARPMTETLAPPALLFVMAVLANESFGQREHLMLIAGLPYVFLAAARAERVQVGLAMRIVIAVCAGLTLAQKPHFMAIPALVESWLLLRRGWRTTFSDLVPWIVGAIAVGHLVLVFTVFRPYADFVLPFIKDFYSALGETTWRELLFGSVLGPTLLALLGFGLLAASLSRTVAARALICFGAGAAAAAAMQAKGWPYHVYPALSAAIVLAALTIAQVIDRFLPMERGAHRRPVAAIGATFMILLFYQAALFAPPFQKQREFDESMTAVLSHVVNQNAPNKKVLVLSPGIYPFYPLLNYTDVRMTMRFQTMWVLQGVYASCEDFPTLFNTPEVMSDAERFVFDTVPEDFAKQEPDLLIVDRVAGVPRCQSKAFDYLDYFMRNPTFARAFERYTPLMDVDRYSIYRRK
jgi:hypothetical protein